MALADKLDSDVSTIFGTSWNIRDGQVVPATDDVTLSNGAVGLQAVVLYADLANSTKLARTFERTTAAKVVKAYLSTMSQLVKDAGGEVRSFDGDRVMGVFVGGSKNTSAAKCALQMNYVVREILVPKAERWFGLKQKEFALQHCVGVAGSEVLVVRGGVRGSNDLVFVGSAPNIAAKLSEIRNSPYHSYITWDVYGNLADEAKISADGVDMWASAKCALGDETWACYASRWQWKP
jgi:class 3 adenylate cyclase